MVGVVAGVVLGVEATDCAGESVPDGGRFCCPMLCDYSEKIVARKFARG